MNINKITATTWNEIWDVTNKAIRFSFVTRNIFLDTFYDTTIDAICDANTDATCDAIGNFLYNI